MASTSRRPLINLLRGWPSTSLLPVNSFRASANAALSDPNIAAPALLYGPDGGYGPLQEALAAWLSDFYRPKAPITAQRLCISGGASQNLACVLQVYTDPIYTRNVWMVSPTYYLACRIFEDSGFRGKLKSVPEDSQGINISYLYEGLRKSEHNAQKNGNNEPKLKPPRAWNKIYRHVIYAVPTFANPSSKTMPLARREELVRVAREFDALIVTDDVYDQLQWPVDHQDRKGLDTAIEPRLCDVDRFLDGGSERPGADGFGNACSNGSFSKLVGPGCRTGWAEGAIKFAYGLSQCGSSRSGGAPSQAVAAMLAGYVKDGLLQQHIIKALRPAYAERYRLAMDAIKRVLVPLGIELPQHDRSVVGGYFIWIQLPAPLLANDVSARLKKEHNVIIAEGPLFGVYGDERKEELERAVRLCFSWEDEDLLVDGIEKLGEVVRQMLTEA